MEPTKFRTVSLPAVGSRSDAAVPLVEPRPTFQRVVIVQSTGAPGAFVSASAQELNTSGAIFGLGFQLIVPGPFSSMVLVISPHQTLYGVGTSLVIPTRVSISTSVEVPAVSKEFEDECPSTWFRTISIPTVEAIQIVPGGGIPKRVVIESRPPPLPAPASSIFISDSAEELNIPSPVPGGSFELLRSGSRPPRVIFITAPQQPLYAIHRPAMGPANISVSVSNLHLAALRGPTGIPGPDGEE
ncbi:hypothetical protein LCGC14_0522980 [marine sediment metagenome]|uniref:Uncharacterized protein n=1 Tax=marine sediment metagenome TaxID=412755 RepID=A0A0F9UJI1_9ZZZZ